MRRSGLHRELRATSRPTRGWSRRPTRCTARAMTSPRSCRDYSTSLRGFDDEIEPARPGASCACRRSPTRALCPCGGAARRQADRRRRRPRARAAGRARLWRAGRGCDAAACAVPADLYIAHYVAALPAAGAAAQRHRAMLGFDAEDFHSGEGMGSPAEARRMAMVRVVEGAWLPRCRHLTAAAPLIGDAYASLYKRCRAGDRAERLSARHGADAASIAAPAGSAAAGLLVLADHRPRPRPAALPAGDGPRRPPQIELEIRGDDPWGHGEALKTMARELGIADRLRVLPWRRPRRWCGWPRRTISACRWKPTSARTAGSASPTRSSPICWRACRSLLSDTPAQRALAPDLGAAAALVPLSDPTAIAAALDRLARRARRGARGGAGGSGASATTGTSRRTRCSRRSRLRSRAAGRRHHAGTEARAIVDEICLAVFDGGSSPPPRSGSTLPSQTGDASDCGQLRLHAALRRDSTITTS